MAEEEKKQASPPEAEQKPQETPTGEGQKLSPDTIYEVPVNGKIVKMTGEEIQRRASGEEKFTQNMQAIRAFAKKLGITISPDTTPEQIEGAIWQKTEESLLGTDKGKDLLKTLYEQAYGTKPSGTAEKQIEKSQIPDDLAEALGRENVEKLLSLTPKGVTKQELDEFKKELIKTVKDEMETRELADEAEAQLDDLQDKLKVEFTPKIKEALLAAWAESKDDKITIEKIWNEEFVPILQKIKAEKPLSDEEKAKIVGEGIKEIGGKPEAPKAEPGGASPAEKPASTYEQAEKELEAILEKYQIPHLK